MSRVWLVIILVAIAVLAALPPNSDADVCGVRKKVVVHDKAFVPIAIPTAFPVVAVPVYSYVNAPGFVPGIVPGVTPGAAQGVVPGAAQGVVPGAVPGSAGQPYDMNVLADLVAKRIVKLQTGGQPGDQPATQQGGPPPVTQQAVPDGDAVGILRAKCSSCHSGAATAGGGFVMFDASKQMVNLGADDKIDIYDAVFESRMPKGDGKLTDQEVEIIRRWIKKKR